MTAPRLTGARTPRAARRVAFALITLTGLSACESSGPGSPSGPLGPGAPATPSASALVSMTSADDGYGSASNTFTPNNVYIVLNGTVTWNNASGTSHNVTFAGGAGAPASIASFGSGSQERTFTASGTFNYTCTLHTGMSGSVRVATAP